ncbi:hypothetical protein BH11PSE4_BH11PSE4_36560 [soil metagenome]
MKKILVSVLALGGVLVGTVAQAASSDDVSARLATLEKENAAMRAENAALRQNKALREQNAALKSSVSAAAPPHAGIASAAKSSDPFGAYAADLPTAYKAPVMESPRQFWVWAEGGAIWSGGDPINSDYTLTGLAGLGIGGLGGSIPGSFDLTPKVGWEGAGGFDYRFAGSPWHVSGQFRYGEGKASESASTSGSLDPAVLAAFGGGLLGGAATSLSGTDALARSNKETHWLADIAVGRDVLGNGPDSMQVKFGVRLAEWVGKQTSTQVTGLNINFSPPADVFGDGSLLISQYSATQTNTVNQRASYIGVGPRVGIEGAVPLAGNWAFDYLADVAALFGNQKLLTTTSTSTTVSPAIIGAIFGGGTGSSFTNTTELFAPAISADLQVGVSYWVQPNVKVSASYRIDAFTVFNTTGGSSNVLPNRYTHGPRLGASATF